MMLEMVSTFTLKFVALCTLLFVHKYRLYSYACTTYAFGLPVNFDFPFYESEFAVFYHPFPEYISHVL